jgi:hypothetical protein
VIPKTNSSPGSCELPTLTELQLSVAVGGDQFTTAMQLASAGFTTSEMHPLIFGAVSSFTTTLKLQVEEFPTVSVKVYVT